MPLTTHELADMTPLLQSNCMINQSVLLIRNSRQYDTFIRSLHPLTLRYPHGVVKTNDILYKGEAPVWAGSPVRRSSSKRARRNHRVRSRRNRYSRKV